MDAQYSTAMPISAFYPGGQPPLMPPPPPDIFQPRIHHVHSFALDNLGSYPELPDPTQDMSAPQQGSQRVRRRPAPGSEHVKHRRTRSGCFTCRQRRVKCDEKQPICNRCRKGKRECAYPESSSASSSRPARKDSKAKSVAGGSSPSGDEDEDDVRDLDPILDEDEDLEYDDEEPASATSEMRIDTSIPSASSSGRRTSYAVVSPSMSRKPSKPRLSRTSSKQSVNVAVPRNSKWSNLSEVDQSFLVYHRDKLSYHHYAFKMDGNNFLKTTFLEIAVNDQSQALLYSIIAFAAYHRAMERADFELSSFLSYYNQSIILLRQSLMSKKPGIATLLTILQLATIEEFLGDWANLLGHQRAAHQMLTDLFSPQTIMQDETRRRIISWYIRFDLFAGMMSGSETRLGREWFAASHEHYYTQAKDRPDDLAAQFENHFATSRLLATDVALLFAGKVKGTISDEAFGATVQELLARFAANGKSLEVAFNDRLNYIKDFPGAGRPRDDEITNFRDPYFLRAGELFTMNFVLLDFWAIDLMFKYNLAKVQGDPPGRELTENALKICKMFEAIQYCEEGPPGVIIGCQASLGIASLFLPRDERHTTWCQQKYAIVERAGYIYPMELRKQLSETWGFDVTRWWFPNDEGYPDIIRAVRDFIAYRTSQPKDKMAEHLRDMSGLFRSMTVDESSPDAEAKALSPHLSDTGSEQKWQG